MECRNSKQLNPELESLRMKVLQESSLSNEWILRLIDRTTHIHAGFLFEDLKTLQNLCLFIGETQSKITDPGWQALGYHLGLSPSVLKVINYNNFNKEDPCYNVLLAYVQYDNATIGKILEALFKMKRIDVLSRIQNSINDLADVISQYSSTNYNNSIEETSDYESLSAVEGQNESEKSTIISTDISNSLIKPRIIPPAPFIFQNIKAVPELTIQQIQQATNQTISNSIFIKDKHIFQNILQTVPDLFSRDFKRKCIVECVQNQYYANYKENLTASNKKNYGLKIMLTFAEDGKKYAEEVCRVFRTKRENYSPIGVLVLSEHAEIVNKDPLQFISGAFAQVDYVCPILTEGYFKLVTKKQKISVMSNMYLDSFYVPYIYRLMNSYFVSNDCLNDKVRCIVPDSEFFVIPLSYLWTNPVFGAWVKLSEVGDLALRLLKKESVSYLRQISWVKAVKCIKKTSESSPTYAADVCSMLCEKYEFSFVVALTFYLIASFIKMMAAHQELNANELLTGAGVLSRPAEEFENAPSLEFMWAKKAYEHAEVYFNILCSVDPTILKLTPNDDEIYRSFRESFPDFAIDNINEDEMKSPAGKEKWREYCEKFKNKVEDYSFGTLLRKDSTEEYTEDNSILVTRIQFLAIELARNREGLNNCIRSKFKPNQTIKI